MISTSSPAIWPARRRGSALALRRPARGSGRTPTWRTADTFCGRPPMAPTVPSRSIVPVTATSVPPVRLPGESSSISVSVNASPADGPPMLPVSMSISNGRSTDRGVERDEPDDRRVPGRPATAISSTSVVTGSVLVGPVDRRSTGRCRPGCWSASGGDEVVDGVERHAVDGRAIVSPVQQDLAAGRTGRSARRRPRGTPARRRRPSPGTIWRRRSRAPAGRRTGRPGSTCASSAARSAPLRRGAACRTCSS